MIKVRNLATVMAAGALVGLAGCSALGMGGSENQQATAAPPPPPAAAPAPEAAPPPPTPTAELSPHMLRRVQADLKREGLYRGRVDGRWGPMTQAAVTQFQQNHGLQASGNLDEPTLQAMNMGTTTGMSSNSGAASSGTMSNGSMGAGNTTGAMGNMPATGANSSTASGMGTATPGAGTPTKTP